MSVLKPRNRLVNFRLSDEEFDAMRSACGKSGARSLSDFARSAVLRAMQEAESGVRTNGDGGLTVLTRLEALLSMFESRLSRASGPAAASNSPVLEPAHN